MEREGSLFRVSARTREYGIPALGDPGSVGGVLPVVPVPAAQGNILAAPLVQLTFGILIPASPPNLLSRSLSCCPSTRITSHSLTQGASRSSVASKPRLTELNSKLVICPWLRVFGDEEPEVSVGVSAAASRVVKVTSGPGILLTSQTLTAPSAAAANLYPSNPSPTKLVILPTG